MVKGKGEKGEEQGEGSDKGKRSREGMSENKKGRGRGSEGNVVFIILITLFVSLEM